MYSLVCILSYVNYLCICNAISQKLVTNCSHKIYHLVAIRIGMNKMAKGDKYLDYLNETLERVAKPWDVSLGEFLGTKWRV